jgi:hypothetical protein
MRSTTKFCLAIATMLTISSSASANLVNIQKSAASISIGPNLTSFDTVASAGATLALDLAPGVAQTLQFYAVGLNPTCDVAVCNGTFTRGLNFGFVTAQDTTLSGSGFVSYVQSVKDTISSANTLSSSHALSIGNGGFDLHLSNGEKLSVGVVPQSFDAVASGGIEQVESLSASFLLTAAAVPEPAASATLALVMALFAVVRVRRLAMVVAGFRRCGF